MRFKPGHHLVERELIEQTGVSRTTIREVLRQLAAEGLVVTVPNRGTVVATPTFEQAVELYEVRAVLEGMATRQFVQRASAAQIRELRSAFEEFERAAATEDKVSGLLEAKKRFYEVLFGGAGNSTVRSIVEGLQARVSLLRAASLSQPGRIPDSVEEIRAIVTAVEAGDPEAAARACAHHVEQAGQVVFRAMGEGR
ncbi:MAG: FCD domain-containing protein [Streptosporangiales bacterium]|nr:FCD domain-containing protein [Streptosporangiales bacterium]